MSPPFQYPAAVGFPGPETSCPVRVAPSFHISRLVLPFEFTAVEQAPKPLDTRVSLDLVPAKVIAAVVFPGAFNKEVCHNHFEEMKTKLKEKLFLGDEENIDYTIAQYHPPFTLPFFRRNEVWIRLEDTNPQIMKLLEN